MFREPCSLSPRPFLIFAQQKKARGNYPGQFLFIYFFPGVPRKTGLPFVATAPLTWRGLFVVSPFSSSGSVHAASFPRVCDHVHPPPFGHIYPLICMKKKILSPPPERVVGFPCPRPALSHSLTLCVGVPIAHLLCSHEGSTGEGEQETEAARVERKRKKKRRRAERAAAEAAAGAGGGASAGPNSSRVAGAAAAAKAVKKNKESSAVYASLFGTKKVSNEHLFIATAGHRYNLG